MISSAEDDCLTKLNALDTDKYFKPLGAGNNAIVLQYTGEEQHVEGESKKKKKSTQTCLKQNAIVKVFDDKLKEAANRQLQFFTDPAPVGTSQQPILKILDKCGAAAMPKYCLDDPKLCLFQAKCPKTHVPENLETTYTSEMCWYLVLLPGGEKTLQQCFQGDDSIKDKEFLLLMKKATDISQCLHEEKLAHGDFQLKNIMTNACTQEKPEMTRNGIIPKAKKFKPIVQAVDLDGVTYAPDSVDDEEESYTAKGSFKAYRDLRMFIGAESSNGDSLTDYAQIKDSAAAKEIMQWANENLPTGPKDNKWDWAATQTKETAFREKLDEMLERFKRKNKALKKNNK